MQADTTKWKNSKGNEMGSVTKPFKKAFKSVTKPIKKYATKTANVATLGLLGERGIKNLTDTVYGKVTGGSTPASRAASQAAAQAKTAAGKAKAAEAAKKAKTDKSFLDAKKVQADRQRPGRGSNFATMLSRFKSFSDLPQYAQNKLERGIVGRAKIQSNEDLFSLLRRGVSNPFAVERDAAKEGTVSAYDPSYLLNKEGKMAPKTTTPPAPTGRRGKRGAIGGALGGGGIRSRIKGRIADKRNTPVPSTRGGLGSIFARIRNKSRAAVEKQASRRIPTPTKRTPTKRGKASMFSRLRNKNRTPSKRQVVRSTPIRRIGKRGLGLR